MVQPPPDLAVRADIEWNGIHRDARNSDATPYALTAELEVVDAQLDGRAILFGPAIGPGGRRYVTTGQGEGRHVHAFSPDGEPLFENAADTLAPSSRVCTDVPLFDCDGCFYVSGERFVHRFDGDGRRLWAGDIASLGARGGFVSTILTKAGHVGGVTLNGEMVLLDRETGRPAKPLFRLPAGQGFSAPPRMPGLWGGGLMDPHLVARVEPGFFGFGFPVTSSPAIDPFSGLIYVAAASEDGATSTLFALDETGNEISIIHQTSIEGLCTASPAVSPDGARVYTVNGKGVLHAIDAQSGGIVWTRAGAGPAGSPAVGFDDRLYSAGPDPETGRSQLLCVEGATGRVVWARNYDEAATNRLPERIGAGPVFPLPAPTAVANSVPAIGPNLVLMLVNAGYVFAPPGGGRRLHQPHVPVLLAIDPSDGQIVSETKVRDTSEAVIVAGADGTVHVCHASLLSSLFHYGVDPHLPEALRSPLPPIGGFTTLKPKH